MCNIYLDVITLSDFKNQSANHPEPIPMPVLVDFSNNNTTNHPEPIPIPALVENKNTTTNHPEPIPMPVLVDFNNNNTTNHPEPIPMPVMIADNNNVMNSQSGRNITASQSKSNLISPNDLQTKLRTGDVTLIDVRMPWEVNLEGRIANSVNIPGKYFQLQVFLAIFLNTVRYTGVA